MPTCVILCDLNSLEVQPCSPSHPCSIPQPCPCSACGLSSTSVPGSLLGAGGSVGEELPACLCSRFLQRKEREGSQSEAHPALSESCGITDQKGMLLCPLQRCSSDVLLKSILLCILSSPRPLVLLLLLHTQQTENTLERFCFEPWGRELWVAVTRGVPKEGFVGLCVSSTTTAN